MERKSGWTQRDHEVFRFLRFFVDADIWHRGEFVIPPFSLVNISSIATTLDYSQGCFRNCISVRRSRSSPSWRSIRQPLIDRLHISRSEILCCIRRSMTPFDPDPRDRLSFASLQLYAITSVSGLHCQFLFISLSATNRTLQIRCPFPFAEIEYSLEHNTISRIYSRHVYTVRFLAIAHI